MAQSTKELLEELVLPYLETALLRVEDDAGLRKQGLALRDALDDACNGKAGEAVFAAAWAILLNVATQAAKAGTPARVQ